MRLVFLAVIALALVGCQAKGSKGYKDETGRSEGVNAPQSRGIDVSGGHGMIANTLHMNVSGDHDRMMVGESAEYTFEVTNRGPGEAFEVVLDVLIPPEMSYVSANGPTKATFPSSIRGVRFGPIAELPEGATATWTVILRGDEDGRAEVTGSVMEAAAPIGPLEVSVPAEIQG